VQRLHTKHAACRLHRLACYSKPALAFACVVLCCVSERHNLRLCCSCPNLNLRCNGRCSAAGGQTLTPGLGGAVRSAGALCAQRCPSCPGGCRGSFGWISLLLKRYSATPNYAFLKILALCCAVLCCAAGLSGGACSQCGPSG
jgi:hypothetical protein